MGAISRETFKRLVLLGTLVEFKDGAYGAKRVHKIVYMALRDSSVKPFTFVRHLYGQFSEELDATKDQLLTMGYIVAEPLREIQWDNMANKYRLSDKGAKVYFQTVLAKAVPELKARITKAVDQYGYLKENDLIQAMYALPEFAGTPEGQPFFEANIPERVDVQLDDEQCEELELALNPSFVDAAARIARGLSKTEIDFSKLRTVTHP